MNESVFLSALPANGSVSSYAVPPAEHMQHSGTADEATRIRRVQQQVQMHLAQRSGSGSATVPRGNGAVHYTSSEYGGSSSGRYATYTPGFSSKSQMFTTSRSSAAIPKTHYSGGFSSRSAMDVGHHVRPVAGRTGVFHSEASACNFQSARRVDPEVLSLHSMRMYGTQANAPGMWTGQDGSEGSLVSDRDAVPYQPDGYVQPQVGMSATLPTPMRRSLSGTLARSATVIQPSAGGTEFVQQYSFKGPAYRTISRINNRTNRMSVGSMPAGGGGGYSRMLTSSQGSLGLTKQTASLSRAMSVKSLRSVGRGEDVFDGANFMADSTGNLNGISNLDMPTAVEYLNMTDAELQVMGAAYIQHECYHNNDAKKQVRDLGGIPLLVQLFSSVNPEVQRYATGAVRNIIYENMENKTALIESGGIPQMVKALAEEDDELRKNITGILWNLSSKENLKDKLAKETLFDLTRKILMPLSTESEDVQQSLSEVDIFYNTTGCLRNLSSTNERTRQRMRETDGLVDSLVSHILKCIRINKMEEKGLENCMCVLRNLSYQLYKEMPATVLRRLEGPTRGQDSGRGEAIGCFTPQSKKAKERKNQDLSAFAEVSKIPKGMEWLWHPKVVGLYKEVLKSCEINNATREAAAGALQNITAGDKRWASVLCHVALEQERILPIVLDGMRNANDAELRSLTGFLRNLSNNARDKQDFATKSVGSLVEKLPSDGNQGEPSSDVVVNICGVLNNLLASTSIAARDISYFDGIQKLVGIKNSLDNRQDKITAAKAASAVLSNMYQYKKLYGDYKRKGFNKTDFVDATN